MNERSFDLNIEKILEGWETRHAIRELIANALDEEILSGTGAIRISRDASGNYHLRDFGRGLRYEHLTQNENEEKLANANRVIGKFGVGLKDALATLNRRGIAGSIRGYPPPRADTRANGVLRREPRVRTCADSSDWHRGSRQL